jgi:hypothetical protein
MEGRRHPRRPSGPGPTSTLYDAPRGVFIWLHIFSSHFIPFDHAIAYIASIVVQGSPDGAPDNSLSCEYLRTVPRTVNLSVVLETPSCVLLGVHSSTPLSRLLVRRPAASSSVALRLTRIHYHSLPLCCLALRCAPPRHLPSSLHPLRGAMGRCVRTAHSWGRRGVCLSIASRCGHSDILGP